MAKHKSEKVKHSSIGKTKPEVRKLNTKVIFSTYPLTQIQKNKFPENPFKSC
jgi:hypothetical protein